MMMQTSRQRDLLQQAEEVSRGVLARWASAVDEENRFPAESVQALREAGLMGYFVPPEAGGLGGDLKTYAQIGSILGESCLSTALIWVMHAHQVAVLGDHRRPEHLPYLERIAGEGALLASVTSEYGKGGDLLRAEAPLHREGSNLRLQRRAPVVSYGAEASFYLVTMRSGPTSPATDVSLVLVTPEDGDVRVTGEWNAMGLRGTCSVPMEFDVLVDVSRLVPSSFREVALQTLVPTAHTGWTAAWLGAARGAFRRFIAQLRSQRSPRLRSDLFLSRLAELRVSLDLTQALLDRVTSVVDELRSQDARTRAYEEPVYNLEINNLKIAGATLPFQVVDGLIELAGMSSGYLRSGELGLERVFRDLRSASLMYSNERLLQANGRLLILEGTPVDRIWRQDG